MNRRLCLRCKNPHEGLIDTCKIHWICFVCIEHVEYSAKSCKECLEFLNRQVSPNFSENNLPEVGINKRTLIKNYGAVNSIPIAHNSLCAGCHISSKDNFPLCEVHSYCSSCISKLKDSTSEYSHELSCQFCTESLISNTQQKNYSKIEKIDQPTQRIGSQTFSHLNREDQLNMNELEIKSSNSIRISSISSCLTCKRKSQVVGFLCNHNLCIDCISKYAIIDILNYESGMQNQSLPYNKKFEYHCGVCRNIVDVPTAMVLKRIRKNNKLLDYNIDENHYNWLTQRIPFYDGIIR